MATAEPVRRQAIQNAVTAHLLAAAKRIGEVYPAGLAATLYDLETAAIEQADARIIAAERAGDLEAAKRAVAEWERAWLDLIRLHGGQ